MGSFRQRPILFSTVRDHQRYSFNRFTHQTH